MTTHIRTGLAVFSRRRGALGALLALLVVGWPTTAEAQLDPLLFLKRSLPTTPQYRANVLIAVDTAPRMQLDADGNYYDPTEYTRGNLWDSALGVTSGNTIARYRRMYQTLQWSGSGPQRFNTSRISIVGDGQGAAYTSFYRKTRLGVAKAAIEQVIRENNVSARFGLLKMRQTNPHIISPADGPVYSSDTGQLLPTDGVGPSMWKMYRGVTDADNRFIEVSTPPLVRPDAANPNATILTMLAPAMPSALLPAGNDSSSTDDAPLSHLLDDARTEAARLAGLDTQCRNTIAVLITGGGESTPGHVPSNSAATFLNVGSGRRVPVYVIAIAPPASSRLAAAEHRDGERRTVLRDHQGADRHGRGQLPAGARSRERDQCRRAARLRAAHRFQHRADRHAAVRTEQRVPGDQPDRRHREPEGRIQPGGDGAAEHRHHQPDQRRRDPAARQRDDHLRVRAPGLRGAAAGIPRLQARSWIPPSRRGTSSRRTAPRSG